MNPQQAAVQQAARQAWVGFWHSCMRGVGGESVLPFDEAGVAAVLNGVAAPILPARPIEPSTLAQQLEGDQRISDITLADVIVGLDDYFETFNEMRRLNREAWLYFSRVGTPLCLSSNRIWRAVVDNPTPIVNTTDLPGYLGLFFVRSKEEDRVETFDDKPAFLDFHLYQKRRRNVAVVSSWKYTIYDHMEFRCDRNALNKEERKKFPSYGSWGFHYFIGVASNGYVEALPMQMGRYQRLKDGAYIHHRNFVIPPGLHEMAGTKLSVHQYVALQFAIIRGFTAAAVSGVQLSIRNQRGQVARFGIPLSYCRSFFRDRDRGGNNRRNPLLHFVGTHERVRADGKRIVVGEHLRGERHFTWRGYTLSVSAPGIHHPSPEAFAAESLSDDDILPLPERERLITIGQVAKRMQTQMETAPKVPFRRGRPTRQYRRHNIEGAATS